MDKEEKVIIHFCGSGGFGIGSYRYKIDGKEEMGYGFYRPENPNDFFPDYECCSPEEIDTHKTACDEWNKKHTARS